MENGKTYARSPEGLTNPVEIRETCAVCRGSGQKNMVATDGPCPVCEGKATITHWVEGSAPAQETGTLMEAFEETPTETVGDRFNAVEGRLTTVEANEPRLGQVEARMSETERIAAEARLTASNTVGAVEALTSRVARHEGETAARFEGLSTVHSGLENLTARVAALEAKVSALETRTPNPA